MRTEDLPQTQLEAVRYFANPEKCHDFLVAMRWSNGVCCAHCGSEKVGKLVVTVAKSRSKKKPGTFVRRLWNCGNCRKQFTAKTGTIFEDSALGLDKWLPAVWMIVNAKNGISSCELARSLGITQKSAWHMGHRIRVAMHHGIPSLFGEVEADESYIGGRSEFKHADKKAPGGRSIVALTPVAGLLQRPSGDEASRVKVEAIDRVRKRNLVPNILRNVTQGSTIFTDSFASYRGLYLAYKHEVIDHAIAYCRGRVHTNGVENFWSLLKRMLKGTYVSVDRAHLFRYLDEEATRFNERTGTDAERFVNSMQRVSGRRLTYHALTGKA